MARTRGKGEGSIYKAADGRWTASLELPADPVTGRRRRAVRRASSKAAAVAKLRELQAQAATLAAPRGRMTVGKWMGLWIEQDVAPRRKPATTRDYRSILEVHVAPAIGSRHLDELTAADVRRLHQAVLRRGDSSTTANKVHRALRACLSAAEREGLVPRNVARLVAPPPAPVRAPRAMTAAEARAFLAHHAGAPDELRWRLALTLGMRQGEALGILLEHLHLDAPAPFVDLAWELRRVTWAHGCGPRHGDAGWPCGRKRGVACPAARSGIPEAVEAVQAHGGLWLLRPKTVGSLRRVALPPMIVDAARRLLDVERPERFLFEVRPGVPVDPRRDHEAWKEVLAAEDLPAMRLHAARHTCATLLLEEGVDARTIQEILGQTQALTTARYTHPSLGVQDAALAALERSLS